MQKPDPAESLASLNRLRELISIQDSTFAGAALETLPSSIEELAASVGAVEISFLETSAGALIFGGAAHFENTPRGQARATVSAEVWAKEVVPPRWPEGHFQVHLPFELEWIAAMLKYNIAQGVIRSFDISDTELVTTSEAADEHTSLTVPCENCGVIYRFTTTHAQAMRFTQQREDAIEEIFPELPKPARIVLITRGDYCPKCVPNRVENVDEMLKPYIVESPESARQSPDSSNTE